jgi:hypothetical protein
MQGTAGYRPFDWLLQTVGKRHSPDGRRRFIVEDDDDVAGLFL